MAANASLAGVLEAVERAVEERPGPITFLAGSVIMREGEHGGHAYLIESGQARVSKRIGGTERDIAVLGPGELIGEMAPIDNRVRSATVTAITQVNLVPIGRAHLESLLEHSDPLLNVMLRIMFGRLRDMQQRLSDATVPEPAGAGALLDDRHRRALESASEQLRLEQALANALKRREYVLQFQPIVSIGTGEIAGFEALIRWVRPDVGMVPPLDFVRTAERTGLIVPIGLWVLEQAAFLQQRMRNALRAATGRARPLFISVNVSARQLRRAEDVQAMCSAIHASGADPSLLKLEITENVLMEQGGQALEALQRFRSLGVGIAIDDFGTGYSSLSYLHRYPVTTLKIDRSFVTSMVHSRQSRALMRSIIGLAGGLEMDVIAEGIERAEERKLLAEMGCPLGQGYLFSRPVPLEEAERMLAKPPRR